VWSSIAQEVYDAFKLAAKHAWLLKSMASAAASPPSLTWTEMGFAFNPETMDSAIGDYNKDKYSDQVAFTVFPGFSNGIEQLKMMVYPMVKTST
jgi:hypothetical protein